MSNPILDVTNKAIESQDLTNKFMSKALDYLNSAEAFTKAEVPKYIEELLNFKFIEHLIEYFDDLTVLFIITVALGLTFKYAIKRIKIVADEKYDGDIKKAKNDDDVALPIIFSSIFFTAFGIWFLVSAVQTSDLIQAYKIKTAPRVYLIDYIRGHK